MVGGRFLKTSGRFAILAAAGIFMSGYALSSAQAGGLGGDCCADLEERVAELEATTVRKGNRKVSMRLYGQVNKALLYWNDDVDEDIYVVDNQGADSRIGVKGAARVHTGFWIGYNLEWNVHTAGSSVVNQFSDDGFSGFSVRQSYLYFKSDKLGKITIGNANQVAAGISEIDLSGTKVVATARGIRWNQFFFLRNSTTGNSITIWGTVFPYLGHMGGTRQNLIRYDSPSIAGFVVSASWGEDDNWGAALRYAQAFGDIKVAAGIAYWWASGSGFPDGNANGPLNNQDTSRVVGSAAIKHTPTGLNLHVAAGQAEQDSNTVTTRDDLADVTFWYVKAGITNNYTGIGNTALYGEYYQADDVNSCKVKIGFALAGGCQVAFNFGFATGIGNVIDRETNFWGLGIVQNINAAATELYLAYRHFEHDATVINGAGAVLPDAPVGDLDMVMAGARIKF